MRVSQLPDDVAMEIVADCSQYPFLSDVLSYFIWFKNHTTLSPETSDYFGFRFVKVRGRFQLRQEKFSISNDMRVVGKRSGYREYILALPLDSINDVMRVDKIRRVTPFFNLHKFYKVGLPKSRLHDRLEDPRNKDK